MTPIKPLLPVQTGSQSLLLKQSYLNNHKRYISNFRTIVQIVNCQKIITERWPQIDLYFLSKPEVEKKKYSRGNVLRNFNMVCILSDVNKIDPNLTFRSSRTPSVCQYKHQSLVFVFFLLLLLRIDCLQKNTYLKTSHELETWHILRT